MTALAHLDIELRTRTGKGASRALRREGRIPAVLYGGMEAPVHFSLNPIQFHKALHQEGFLSTIFEISVNSKQEKMLPKEVHFHPVTDLPLHVDFMRVSKGKKLTLLVPLKFINEEKAPGIKRGGVLNIVVHNLEVIADMDHIPAYIEIDLAGVDIHHTIQLKNLTLPAGVKAAHPERDDSIANIVAPTVMKKTNAGGDAEGTAGTGSSESK